METGIGILLVLGALCFICKFPWIIALASAWGTLMIIAYGLDHGASLWGLLAVIIFVLLPWWGTVVLPSLFNIKERTGSWFGSED